MNITFDTTTIIFILLLIIILILAWMVYRLDSKLKKFLIGSKVDNLPGSLSTIESSITGLENFKNEVETYLATVESRLKRSTQAVHTVRFNPFKGTTGSGGNQSFATAFLNEHGDGVVISSLYSRDHVSVFAKPVTKGKSEYELSAEEVQAISEASKIVK